MCGQLARSFDIPGDRRQDSGALTDSAGPWVDAHAPDCLDDPLHLDIASTPAGIALACQSPLTSVAVAHKLRGGTMPNLVDIARVAPLTHAFTDRSPVVVNPNVGALGHVVASLVGQRLRPAVEDPRHGGGGVFPDVLLRRDVVGPRLYDGKRKVCRRRSGLFGMDRHIGDAKNDDRPLGDTRCITTRLGYAPVTPSRRAKLRSGASTRRCRSTSSAVV